MFKLIKKECKNTLKLMEYPSSISTASILFSFTTKYYPNAYLHYLLIYITHDIALQYKDTTKI